MVRQAGESATGNERAARLGRREDLIWWGTWLGLVCAVVGIVDGLVMALNKELATCPDGTYFPEGTTDFDCYAYPQAGLGIGIIVVSVMLGVLVVFASIAARATLRAGAVLD
ncbi:hypothetical protein [Nocardioides bizhenqiangii]|uniref:Uncharacterized protein n=1 Tax=Nocardioides bizhenqiangii TaxID=3095076 RepID=A0ABZ0ZRP9_9ACTN|nr:MULTISPECIES: hypothetical protein [unclassified Nocardioides]MDZ5619537.1 hypothetical protein [Nocardioides sp. HM23]WQQ26446.1 hypothetical protein SHK19_21135 [Nocardioides sp. HM61]